VRALIDFDDICYDQHGAVAVETRGGNG
jgi:hypothetical protein